MTHPGAVSAVVSGAGEFPVPPGGVTLIVGANSSGKSTTLRDIASGVSKDMFGDVRRVISEVRFQDPTDDEMIEIAEAFTFLRDGVVILSATGIEALIGDSPNRLAEIAEQYKAEILAGARAAEVSILDGSNRLGLVQPQEALDLMSASSGPPMQRLVVDSAAMRELSDTVSGAFGKELCVDPPGRKMIQLNVGKVPVPYEPVDVVAHAARVAALPPLIEEGDGLKAYAGILLSLLGERKKYTFIDEPEAFLHPPQARELGRMISKLAADENLQVFIATHSRDIVLGALDSGFTPTLIRLSRDQDNTDIRPAEQVSVRSLTVDDIQSLWADPIIRYSNALDGIFYERVVVAEADSDCRWYGAVVDHMRESDPSFGRDVLFVPAGGKHKVPEILRALVGLGVNARATVDFDALNDPQLAKSLVLAAGGDWNGIEPMLQRLTTAVAGTSRNLDVEQVRQEIGQILNAHKGPATNGLVDRIAKTVPMKGGWAEAKRHGIDALKGQQRTDAKELLSALDDIGIVVVECGEVEGFDRDAGGHGPSWVSAALERDSHFANLSAEAHVRRLLA